MQIQDSKDADRIKVIVSLTAAYVVGNIHEFRKQLKLANKHKLTDNDLLTLTDIAWLIKEKAQEQLDKLLGKAESEKDYVCCSSDEEKQNSSNKNDCCDC